MNNSQCTNLTPLGPLCPWPYQHFCFLGTMYPLEDSGMVGIFSSSGRTSALAKYTFIVQCTIQSIFLESVLQKKVRKKIDNKYWFLPFQQIVCKFCTPIKVLSVLAHRRLLVHENNGNAEVCRIFLENCWWKELYWRKFFFLQKMSYNFLRLLRKISRQCLLIALFILATLLNKIGPFFCSLGKINEILFR